ncbi:MAG: LytTR family transcriptional regulator DNA-binding domain-containing protein [Syntrophomonas sp.]
MIVFVSEEYQSNFLRSILEQIPGITPIFEAGSLDEFYTLARKHGPQMAIVDAQLIDDNRHEFYERSYRYVPEMILINNFCQFAVCSFLEVRRIYHEPPTKETLEQLIMGIMQRTSTRVKAGLLSIKTKGSLVNVVKDEVLFIEADSGKCLIHTRRGIFSVRSTLDNMERQLGEGFLRVHRSFIVNVKAISQVRYMHDRTYEIEFLNYNAKALMSRYKSQIYYDMLKNQ